MHFHCLNLTFFVKTNFIPFQPVYDISTIQSFGGRSFAPADLMDEDNSVFDSVSHLGDDIQSRSFTPTPTATPSLLDHCDKSFFLFDTYPPDVSTIEEEKSFDLDETDQGPSRHNNLRNESFNHAIAAPPSPSQQMYVLILNSISFQNI